MDTQILDLDLVSVMAVESTGGNPVPRLSVPIPKPFDGTQEGWQSWKNRFERYRIASGLCQKDDREQVSVFLYSMGECVDDILLTLTIDEMKATYNEVERAISSYFNARKNVIVERAKFNKRAQKPGETVDSFIKDLHKLAAECNFGALKEELIRDRIVVGITDDVLSEELQSKPNLTLVQAIQLSRQAEDRKVNQPIIRSKPSDTHSATECVNRINNGKPDRSKYRSSTHNLQPHTHKYHNHTLKSQNNTQNFHNAQFTHKRCGYCGKEPHARAKCPAHGATCSNCNKKGHYWSVCHSRKKIHEIQHDDNLDDDFDRDLDLGNIFRVQNESSMWTERILVDGEVHNFILDTGASVSVVPESWATKRILKPTQRRFRGPGGLDLPVLGYFQASLQHRNEHIEERLYVLKGQPCCLLSRLACVALNLVKRVNNVANVKSTASPTDSSSVMSDFPQLFTGLGKLNTAYSISLKPEVRPVSAFTASRVAKPLIPKVKQELDRMLTEGVISPVTEPTAWCSRLVVVPKANGSVRLCVDLTNLNKAVHREAYPMNTVEDSLSKLAGSKVFSKLDANSSFYQLPLDEESRLFTTFITPFGRYCFNRMPMGICSAPEVFQRAMTSMIGHLDGVICHMDDVLVHAPSTVEHDSRLKSVLHALQESGLTLSPEKCEFSQSSVRFLGHIIDESGIHADPSKIAGIQNFPAPSNITELQRFLGMANQLAKFIPNLAVETAPLRSLLRKNTVWMWGPPQQEAFQRIKTFLTSSPVLAHYNLQHETIIAADASNAGIGAVLFQLQKDKSRRPICYISRSLTEAETKYAVIEKEALAATWACERLSDYILGLNCTLETDHRPLVSLLGTKDVNKMPPRIQRFRLRIMRFNVKVVHVSGKIQTTADALSRAPASEPNDHDYFLVGEVSALTKQTIDTIQASGQRLQQIRDALKDDTTTSQVMAFCKEGWPVYKPHDPSLHQYYNNQQHFSVVDDLLLYDDRIVIPTSLRMDILDRIHDGHQGVTKCQALARNSVWWPNISSQVEEMVRKCDTCKKLQPARREPLLSTETPERPWSKVGIDLFEFKGNTYVLVCDYLSRWIEMRLLHRTTTTTTIDAIKAIFATHGIPDIVVSDNGPQFSSHAFHEFAENYGFCHVTSSPRYPQSNGEAERAVRTLKNLLKKSPDPHLALLTYRSTPLHNGISPSEILMGRKLRNRVPTLPSKLQIQPPDMNKLHENESIYKENQRKNYNKRHKARLSTQLDTGEPVFIRDMQKTGVIINKHHAPRSYIVKTDQGNVRRNRKHLVATPNADIVSARRPTHATFELPSPPTATPTATATLPTATQPTSTSPAATLPTTTATPLTTTISPTSTTPTLPLPPTQISRYGRPIKQPSRLDL